MVLFFLILSSHDSLLSCELHLNLLFLNVLEAFDLVLFAHFGFPAVEFRSIFKTHGHLVKFSLLFSLFKINQMLLSFQSRNVELDISIVFIEVGHLAGLGALKLKLSDNLLLSLFLHSIGLRDSRSTLRGQSKPLLRVSFVIASDGIDRCLSPLFFVFFDISQRQFMCALWHRPRFDLSFYLLRCGNHFWLLLCQVERLELCFFRLLLFFITFGKDVRRHACVMGRHVRLRKLSPKR